jgi:hypothetical protein
MLGIDFERIADCSKNKLLTISDNEFRQLISFIAFKQKYEKIFSNIPETDYETVKSKI